jgi:hypothetical protein
MQLDSVPIAIAGNENTIEVRGSNREDERQGLTRKLTFCNENESGPGMFSGQILFDSDLAGRVFKSSSRISRKQD